MSKPRKMRRLNPPQSIISSQDWKSLTNQTLKCSLSQNENDDSIVCAIMQELNSSAGSTMRHNCSTCALGVSDEECDLALASEHGLSGRAILGTGGPRFSNVKIRRVEFWEFSTKQFQVACVAPRHERQGNLGWPGKESNPRHRNVCLRSQPRGERL